MGPSTPVSVAANADWQLVSQTLGPFAYMFAQTVQPPKAVRRFRLRVCYADPVGDGILEVKFATPNPILFNVPRVSTGAVTSSACVHTQFKTFGNGTQAEVDPSHGFAYARRTNGAGTSVVYEVYIEAHDFYPTETDLMANAPTKVSDRILFPIDNSVPALNFDQSMNGGYQSIGQLVLGPFAYLPGLAPNSIRKFRLRACYFDESVSRHFSLFNSQSSDPHSLPIRCFRRLTHSISRNLFFQSGQPDHLEVRFNVRGTPIFTLPTIASGEGPHACLYTDFLQFGSGTAADSPEVHGNVDVRFVSAAAYNNHAALYFFAIETHDFPQVPVPVQTPVAQRFVGERLLFPLSPQDYPPFVISVSTFFGFFLFPFFFFFV
jgi:hypothetical protein